MKLKLLFLMLMLIPLTLSANPNYASLEGTWKYNKQSSKNISELLKMQGRSYFERKYILALDITQAIKVASNKVHIQMKTSVKNMSYILHVDGKSRRVKSQKGKYINVMCKPSAKGIIVVSKNSKGIITVSNRYVSGSRLFNHIKMTAPNGKVVNAIRVFDRVK